MSGLHDSTLRVVLRRWSRAWLAPTLALLVVVSAPVEARTLSFSSATPPTRSAENDVLNWWTAEVQRRTNGSLTIKVYHMQALAKLKDAVEAVSTGVADIAYVIPAYSQSKLPLWYLSSTALGSGDQYVAAEAWRRVRERFPEIAAEERKNNFQYIGHYSIGPSVLVSRTRPYVSPAEFKGDKVRLSSRYLRAAKVNGWKVTSVQLVMPEVYTGLERGTLDGALTYLTQILQYRHHEVSKFVVETNSGQQTNLLVMNLRTWNSLTEKERAVLTELQPLYRERIAQASLTEAKVMQQKLKTHPKYPLQFTTLDAAQRRFWESELKESEEFDIQQSGRWAPQAAKVYAAYQQEQQKVAAEVQQTRYPWERSPQK